MTLREARREFREIPLGLIDDPELASRASMDDAKMDELTRSISRDGVLQPLLLGRKGERYEVIAGHRRSMAARRAGLVAVPAIVYESVDAAHEAAKYAENRFREELNPAEEAIFFAELLERDAGGDVDRLCELLGEKRAYVEGRLLLFGGDPVVFEALQHGRIGIGVAEELNRCPDEAHRRYLLDNVARHGATKAIVAGYVQQWKAQQRAASGEPLPVSGAENLAPIPQSNPFTCVLCRGTDHIETMRPFNMHLHCVPAILDRALAMYRNQGDYVAFPRTRDEAIELAGRLADRFPELFPVNT